MKSFLRLTRKKTALLVIVLFQLLAMLELASSQPVQEDPNKPSGNEGMLRFTMNAFIIASVIILLFFISVFTLYFFHHCTEAVVEIANPSVGARTATSATVARSLDASIVETFPTFVYSEVKTKKIGNGALECAICLSEFEDNETLRLLPKCNHVFHIQCIDAWFKGHVTCPVCRTDLTDQEQITKPVQPEVITETNIESQQMNCNLPTV